MERTASDEQRNADAACPMHTPLQVTRDGAGAALPPRSVVFIHSDAYFRALAQLPVHPRREQMTLALLLGLAREHADCNETNTKEEKGRGLFGMQVIAPSLATEEQLMRFHARDYIETLRRTETESSDADKAADTQATQLRHEAFELVDDAYVFPGLYEYCRSVAGASMTAADALRHLMGRQARLAPVAINLGGGRHHAMRSQASGFCYVNDVVLAIQRLLSPPISPAMPRVDRVLCIDIDVHHGDGVQEAFYFSPTVTTISFHLREPAFFPGTGGQDEIGKGRGKYHSINVPLQRGVTDENFTTLFDKVVSAAVRCVEPQVLVLVSGVDTLARDMLGGFNMTNSGIATCVKKLMSFNLPLLLLGGGGYSGSDACRALAAAVLSVVAPSLDLDNCEVPEHDYYEEYGPGFRMTTSPVIHRPNKNTTESIAAVEAGAIEILENAREARAARVSKHCELNKRKRGEERVASNT